MFLCIVFVSKATLKCKQEYILYSNTAKTLSTQVQQQQRPFNGL